MANLGDLFLDRALLVATCEVLAKHMNGSTMRRLRFLLEELSLSQNGESLYNEDREWLRAGINRAHKRSEYWTDELARLRDGGIRVIACVDDDYPLNLRIVHDGPPLLFFRGAFEPSDRRAVAIVGTRSASPDGLNLAGCLASAVVERGFTVVSGLAAGIDTAAHASALNAGGRTIAVFGTDIEQVYPAANRALAKAISLRGACVSQFLPGTKSGTWSFPARNLTSSGLSMATVVVEASETSGARLQAEAALAHGKSVFLMDHVVMTQQWAKQMVDTNHNANMVSDADTIVDQLETHLEIVADKDFVFA